MQVISQWKLTPFSGFCKLFLCLGFFCSKTVSLMVSQKPSVWHLTANQVHAWCSESAWTKSFPWAALWVIGSQPTLLFLSWVGRGAWNVGAFSTSVYTVRDQVGKCKEPPLLDSVQFSPASRSPGMLQPLPCLLGSHECSVGIYCCKVSVSTGECGPGASYSTMLLLLLQQISSEI